MNTNQGIAIITTMTINKIDITSQYFQTPVDVRSTDLTLCVVDRRCCVVRSKSSSEIRKLQEHM